MSLQEETAVTAVTSADFPPVDAVSDELGWFTPWKASSSYSVLASNVTFFKTKHYPFLVPMNSNRSVWFMRDMEFNGPRRPQSALLQHLCA